jgi:hypothetical protein
MPRLCSSGSTPISSIACAITRICSGRALLTIDETNNWSSRLVA